MAELLCDVGWQRANIVELTRRVTEIPTKYLFAESRAGMAMKRGSNYSYFLPRDAMLAVYAVVVCLSVRPPVCPALYNQKG